MTAALATIAAFGCLAGIVGVWIAYYQWKTSRVLATVMRRSAIIIAAQSEAILLSTRALVDLEEIASRWEPDATDILADDFNDQLDRVLERCEDDLYAA